MTTAQFFFGSSLWALLVLHACCSPLNHGSSQYGGRMNPRSFEDKDAASRPAPPEVVPYVAAPASLYSHDPAPHTAASSSFSSAPEEFRGGAAGGGAAAGVGALAQSGGSFQSGLRAVDWLISPNTFGAAGQPDNTDSLILAPLKATAPESSASLTAELSIVRPLPPRLPEYQPGELTHFEKNVEVGNYDSETEDNLLPFLPEPDNGYLKPLGEMPPGHKSSPAVRSRGSWVYFPYFDYRFLTGGYPTGVYTHFSSSREQGGDHFRDDHYVRESQATQSPAQYPVY